MDYLSGINIPTQSLVVFISIDSLVKCLRVCRQWSVILRPLLEERIKMLPWRFTIEYHEDIIDNVPRVVFHQAWIKIGNFNYGDIRSMEICEYCYVKRKSESILGDWNPPLDFNNVKVITFNNDDNEVKLSMRQLLECYPSMIIFDLIPSGNIYYPYNIRKLSQNEQCTKMKASIQMGNLSIHSNDNCKTSDIYRSLVINDSHGRDKRRKVMTTNIEKLSRFKGFFSHF